MKDMTKEEMALEATKKPLTPAEQDFVDEIETWADQIHLDNREKGFYDRPDPIKKAIDVLKSKGYFNLAIQVESLTERNEIEMLGLATSEIGEAMEAVRKGGPDDHLPMFDGDIVEAADAIIRLMDYAASQAKSGELGEAIVYKLRYNRLRPHKHGKKA